MVEAFASYGSNDTLDERRLPRTAERDQELLNVHAFNPFLEDIPIDSVPISQQILRRGVPGKGLEDLERRDAFRK